MVSQIVVCKTKNMCMEKKQIKHSSSVRQLTAQFHLAVFFTKGIASKPAVIFIADPEKFYNRLSVPGLAHGQMYKCGHIWFSGPFASELGRVSKKDL